MRTLATSRRRALALSVLGVVTLLAGAAPILIDLADRAGVALNLADAPPDAIRAFDPPRLPSIDRAVAAAAAA